MFGGEPLDGPRYIFWNFVTSSKERLLKAASDWRHRRFARIPGGDRVHPAPGGWALAGQPSLTRAVLATPDARWLGSPGPADRLARPPAVSSPCQVRSAISTTCFISSRLAPSAA